MKKIVALVAGLIALAGPAQASQNSLVFNTATGATLTGRDLVIGINGANNTLASQSSGTSAPSNPITYQSWADTSASPTNFKFYDGASWVSFGTLNTSTHVWTPAGGGSGITSLTGDVSASGTGAVVATLSNTATARTNLGLGSMAVVNSPVPVANGGTNATSAGGTALDNISGFASTGFLTRTGAGTYAFQSTTNGVTLANIAQIGTNTLLGNSTAGTANISALSMPSCSTAGSALLWTTNSGFSCNTSITANSATTATNATNITTTNDTSTAATYYPVFQTATGGTNPLKTSNTKLTFNPSTGTLTASAVSTASAAITGGTMTGVSGTFTSLITTTQSAGDNSTKAASTGYVDRATSGASQVLISTATASSSASISFTGLDSTYSSYRVYIDHMRASATGGAMAATMYIAGTEKTDANYYQSSRVEYWDSTYGDGFSGCGNNTSSNIPFVCWTESTSLTGAGFTGWIEIPSPANTSYFKQINWRGQFGDTNMTDGFGAYRGSGGDTGAMTGIKFTFTSGNIASGTFYLYGIRKQ